MNRCNRHLFNPTCYKNDKDTFKKLCKYAYIVGLISKTYFDVEHKIHEQITKKCKPMDLGILPMQPWHEVHSSL